MSRKPTKEEIKAVLEDEAIADLPDGAYWGVVHDRLGLEYGDVFGIIADHPEFFGYADKPND